MADFDIYDDLELLHAQEEQKAVEDLQWKEKYQVAIGTLEKLQNENKDLRKKIKQLEINFASLLETARTEIKRKDNQIAELRREKDNICFRRNEHSVKHHFVEKGMRSDGGNVNPFAVEPLNPVPKCAKTIDRRIDEALTASSSRQNYVEKDLKHSRTSSRDPLVTNGRDRDRSRNRSSNKYDRKDEKYFGRRSSGGDRDLSQNGSSDSSRGKPDKGHNRHFYSGHPKEEKRSHITPNRYASSLEVKHAEDRRDFHKEQKKESKTENIRSDVGLKNNTDLMKINDNIDNQKIASLEEEILRDVKEFKKKKLSETEKSLKPETDILTVAVEKTNEFLDALFEDMTMNDKDQPSDQHADLGTILPMGVDANVKDVTDVNEKKNKETIAKTDENCNVEFQLRTPRKQSVTKLFDDLFGPSPASSASAFVGRRNSVSSVGESSSDTTEYVPIAGIEVREKEKKRENSKKFVPISTLTTFMDNINEVNSGPVIESKAIDNGGCLVPDNPPAKAFRVMDLDSSFYSSEEENDKQNETVIDRQESQSDIESPPFENVTALIVSVVNDVNPPNSSQPKSDFGKPIENDFTFNNRKNTQQIIEKEHRTVVDNKNHNTMGVEDSEKKEVVTLQTKDKSNDIKGDLTNKLPQSEKQMEYQSYRHTSEKNEKKTEDKIQKDSHKHNHNHSSKYSKISSSSKSSCSSGKGSYRSERHKSTTEKHYHQSNRFNKWRHESRRNETNEQSIVDGSSDNNRKSSFERKKDSGERTHSSVKCSSLHEDNSSDLKLYHDHVNSLHCDDISDEEEGEFFIGESSTKNNQRAIDEGLEKGENNAIEEKETLLIEDKTVLKTGDEKLNDCIVETSTYMNGEEDKLNGSNDNCDYVSRTTSCEAELSKEGAIASEFISAQYKSSSDVTVTSKDEGELPIDCIDVSTHIEELSKSKQVEDAELNGEIKTNCAGFGPDQEKPIMFGTDYEIKSKKKDNHPSDYVGHSTDVVEPIKFSIDDKVRFNEIAEKLSDEVPDTIIKSSDCVGMAFEEIKSFYPKTRNDNQVESSEKENKSLLLSTSKFSVETLLENDKLISEQVTNPESTIPFVKHNQDKKDAHHMPASLLESPTKVSAISEPKEETVSSGRRRKRKTPRKCTEDIIALQDFSAPIIAVLPSPYTKSNDDYGLINQPPTQSTTHFLSANSETQAQLQMPTERADGDTLQLVSSTESNDAIMPVGLEAIIDTRNSEISAAILTSVSAVETEEMAVLWVEDEPDLPTVNLACELNSEEKYPSIMESTGTGDSKKPKEINAVSTSANKKSFIEDANDFETTVNISSDTKDQLKKESSRSSSISDGNGCAASESFGISGNKKKHNNKFLQTTTDSELENALMAASNAYDFKDYVAPHLEELVAISDNKKKYKKKFLPNLIYSDTQDQHDDMDLQNSSVSGSNDIVVQQLVASNDKVKKLRNSISRNSSDSDEHKTILQNSPGCDYKNRMVSALAVNNDKKNYKTRILQNGTDSVISGTSKSKEQILQPAYDIGESEPISDSDNEKKRKTTILQNSDAMHPAVVDTCDINNQQGNNIQYSATSEKKKKLKNQDKSSTKASVNRLGSTCLLFAEKISSRDEKPQPTLNSNEPCSYVSSFVSTCSSEHVFPNRNAVKSVTIESEIVSPLKNSEINSNGKALHCNKVDVKSLNKDNLQHFEPPPIKRSTKNPNKRNEKDHNAIYIKRKMRSNKTPEKKTKKHNISSSSSDTISVTESVSQPRRSRMSLHYQKPLTNNIDKLSSPVIKSEKIHHTTTAKRKRSPSHEKPLLSTFAATPTHHIIFQDDNFPEDQQATLPPVYNGNEDDVQYQEIDNRMRSMFQSPTYTNMNGSSIELKDDISNENLTIEETLNQSAKSQCDTSSSAKKLSVGSNDYIIETVGAHTANVFITRKKCKKRMKIA